MTLDPRRPYTVSALAKRWGCSEGLVRKIIRNGELQCFMLGTLVRVTAAEVDRYELRRADDV